MRLLVLLHRWLGVGVCALFAMWFASGIVMHLVPFPSLTEAERVTGLAPIDTSRVRHGVRDALLASGITDAQRVRLVQRADGPVYVIAAPSRLAAMNANDLTDARVTSENVARELALAHAQHRNIHVTGIENVEIVTHDQWTVPNSYDRHRPLYKVALTDPDGTELYVSSATGEIVLDTTRFERGWNYAGSVVHWIYPTILRRNWAAWDRTVWTISLVALVAALTGAVLGVLRLRRTKTGLRSPFRGWHAWHHILGLFSATFVMTWVFSGWLSMDHGRLFSRGQLSEMESATLTPALDVSQLIPVDRSGPTATKEVEWFSLGGQIYVRDRTDLLSQTIAGSNDRNYNRTQSFLTDDDIAAATTHNAPDCKTPIVIRSDDPYPVTASMPSAPVYRTVCGDVWLHIDGANGAVVERLDSSRRAYRWAYAGLHTLNVPVFMNHPTMRSALIVGLCLIGFVFSTTGMVIGWQRLRRQF